MRSVTPQRLVFTYHKAGSSLFLAVMRKAAEAFGLQLVTQYGFVRQINHDADIVLLPHALIGALPTRPFRAIRIVRDPRDIWASSYLYHRRTNEPWCTNTNFDATPPITFPRVPFSFQHLPEAWKREYLAGLGGKSYQKNLVDRDRPDGLAFELARYTRCTLEAMRAWHWRSPEILDIKLETIGADYDRTMWTIFSHLAFEPSKIWTAVEVAASEDVQRMTDAALEARPQIHSRRLSKWRDVLSGPQVTAFEALYGELVTRLDYSPSVAAVLRR